MMPSTVPAVIRTVPVPSPTVGVFSDYDKRVPTPLLLLFDLFSCKTLEILFGKRFHLLHILVESFIVDAILEALYGAVLAGHPAGYCEDRQGQ